jgi:hypothetical protein
MGIVCVLIIFAGFSPSYFLSAFVDRPARFAPITPYIHLHTAVLSAWLLLFITQAALIRSGRRDLHRRLGMLGLVIAVALLIMNFITVVSAINSGRTAPIGPPVVRLYIATSGSVVVAGLIVAGIFLRNRPETHKRLMLLATIFLIGPAINRLYFNLDLGSLLGVGRNAVNIGAQLALIGAGMIYDAMQRRLPHAAYVAGVVVLLGDKVLDTVVPHTDTWIAFAQWVLG